MKFNLDVNISIINDEDGTVKRDMDFNIRGETHDKVSYDYFKGCFEQAGKSVSHVFGDYEED